MEFKLGFCPTMADHAIHLKQKEKSIDLYPFGSAAEALYYLREGHVDGVVIGRFAKKSELSPSIKKQCIEKEGYTLVSFRKGFIENANLQDLPVRTYLPEELVRNKYPELRHITFYTSFEEAFGGLRPSEAALIDWHDYQDELELLIPVENGEKVKKYRLAILFFQQQKEETAKKILG